MYAKVHYEEEQVVVARRWILVAHSLTFISRYACYSIINLMYPPRYRALVWI